MSQLETAPINNPTNQQHLPKQVTNTKEKLVFNFLDDATMHDKAIEANFDQMDWNKIALKNKFLIAPLWTINDLNSWFTQEINPELVFKFLQVSRNVQTFFKYDALLISVQPTIHGFFQGLTKFAYDPAPAADYYSRILGIDISDASYTQFKTFDMTPKTRDRRDMIIPMLTPFAFITRKPTGLDIGNSYTENYLHNYPMGRIRTRVYSQLTTKGTNVSVQMHFSAQVINLKTDGMNYGPPN